MKNLKIGRKLAVSYAVVLFLLVVSTIVSIINLLNIQSEVEVFYNGPFVVKGAANKVNSEFEAMQKAVFRAMANEDTAITNEAIENAGKCASSIQEQLPVIEKNFLGDPAIVERLKAGLTKLAPMSQTVLEMAKQNKNSEAAAYMEQNNIPAIKEIQKELDTLISTANTKGETLIAELRSTQARAVFVMSVLGVSSVIICVIFGVYITRCITRPTAELDRVAGQISKGDLKAVINYESKDELGHLALSMRNTVLSLSTIFNDLTYLLGQAAEGNFNVDTQNEDAYVGEFRPLLESLRRLTTDLSETVRQISQSADQVASGSEQVSGGAQALSQGATEQASSIEELAATINEINGQIKNNADSAEQARGTVGIVEKQLLQSNHQMEEMTKAMDEISQSSGEIGKIIKTIEDIAFQTNILALNAAVEAARAGEAGKGFAVVADEVRNLASKSSEASKSTSALIERSLHAVENGSRIANETAASLLDVVDGTKNITSQITDIADSSIEQARGAAQVAQGVDQISSVVQTNSATAEESAAASEELSGQAQLLRQLMSRFTLKSGTVSMGKAAFQALPVQIEAVASDKY